MIRLLLFALSVFTTLPAFAQNHQTFTMIRPVAVGAAGTGLDAENRVYRAYQGLTYTIHADAVGGHWPYTYSLSNAPAGMAIEAGPCTTIGPECTAGTITWANPQSTANNISVTITDKDGDTVTGTWSITVGATAPGANGYCFLDSVNGNDTTGSGTLASPWATLAKAKTDCGANSILYLRAGTYNTAQQTVGSISCSGAGGQWREDATNSPVIWLGYPGETAVINFRSDGADAVSCVRLWGSNVWIDNLTLDNVGSIGFQVVRDGQFGAVFRNLTGTDILDGENGENSAFIMWVQNFGSPSFYDTVQNSSWGTVAIQGDGAGQDDGCVLKIYSAQWALVETSVFSNSNFAEAIVAIKGEDPHYTVRGNKCTSDVKTCFGGNMDVATAEVGIYDTGGEGYHNLCFAFGTGNGEGCLTLIYAKDGTERSVEAYWYRNTFLGSVVHANSVAGDGPYYLNDNVVLNAIAASGSCPQYITCYNVTDHTAFVFAADNVTGANNGTIANATTGLLVGQSRTDYLGIAGFELDTAEAPAVAPKRFSPRFGIRRGS